MSAVLSNQAEIPMSPIASLSLVPEVEEKPVIVLTMKQRIAAAFTASDTDRRLIRLAAATADLTTINNGAGRDQVHTAAMNLKNKRLAITKVGKGAREDALAYSKAVIAEEGRLIGLIEPEEKRLFTLRDTYDERVKREEGERKAREAARIAAIESRIDDIRAIAASVFKTESSTFLQAKVDELTHVEITDELFEEYIDSATQAKNAAKAALDHMLMAAIDREDEEAERQLAIVAENARLKAEREALEQKQAEMARLEADMAAQRAAMAREMEELAELRRLRDAANAPAQAAQEIVIEPVKTVAIIEPAPEEPEVEPAIERPTAADMILVIADCWNVSQEVAREWLSTTNFTA